MPEVDINYLAILVVFVISMVLGFLWYAPFLFGKAWMRSMGKSESELNKREGMMSAMAIMVVTALVAPYVMAHFVDYAQATTVSEGIVTALWLYVGFVVTVGASQFAFTRRSWKEFAISYGYQLVNFCIMGAVLASWQ